MLREPRQVPKSTLLADSLKQSESLPLLVSGQGVFIFRSEKESLEGMNVVFLNKDGTDGVDFLLTSTGVTATRTESRYKYIDPDNVSGLTDLPGAYYWISLDSQNQRFYVGVGEARLDTIIYTFTFPPRDPKDTSLWEENKRFLESLDHLKADSYKVRGMRLLRDPITTKVALNVKGRNEITMTDIAEARCIPVANMSVVCQQMHQCVSGAKFVLDDADFPEFSKAIEYSIATPGCWCYDTLQEKKNEFNPDDPNIDGTYLRITLGDNDGESPGIPYVMEIWPIGHYSPIHNHAGANAVIRVLRGTINVSLYPFLCKDAEKVEPFAVTDFKKDDVTWITPYLNQVHMLKNLDTSKETCITIQCYLYDKMEDMHYDYFDYVSEKGSIEQYEPDSDAEFMEFKNTMKREWELRNAGESHMSSCFGWSRQSI